MNKFSLVREIRELKNQLSYSKRHGFFFGAGTSCALGIPDITALTKQVKADLQDPSKSHYAKIEADLSSTGPQQNVSIEDILTQVRQIRAITHESETRAYIEINGKQAKALDSDICKSIYKIISASEDGANLASTKKFAAWLSIQGKAYSKEIFTSNYDLIIEKSLEQISMPYLDGFVGSHEPFFWQECLDTFVQGQDLTHNWLRLWKLHGSLNWFWKEAILQAH